ncbi:alpha/beta-hydrolase [Hymenopellis radicata]|nr:alpha/beta-hydrolase [Hymenopellis radicata]
MNPENFKNLKTQRGFTYRYYFSAPAEGKPVLFFSHGFPSGSYLWRKQVAYFGRLGYGLVVPDLLGYGGTDKPTDPKYYVGSGLAHDIVDILDAEKVDKVIAIGHDWGSRVVSRLANYHPDRLIAYAFLATGYGPPDSAYADPIAQSQMIKEMVGYDVLAYMYFFVEDGAPKLVEKNFDSFFSLLYPNSPETWKEHMCSAGGAKAWVENNKTTPLPSYLTSEDKEYYRQTLLGGGMTAPFCWYKVLIAKCNAADDERVPRANVNLTKPTLYVPFTKDDVALPLFGDGTHSQYVKGTYTRKELDGDHWAVMSQAQELNEILVEWINGLAI